MTRLVFVIASLQVISLALGSACTNKKPTSDTSFDCIHTYLEDSVCCFKKLTKSNVVTMSCVEQPFEMSGQFKIEKIGDTETQINCQLQTVELCSSSQFGCEVGEKAYNSLCCYDKEQKVCFTYPYHFIPSIDSKLNCTSSSSFLVFKVIILYLFLFF